MWNYIIHYMVQGGNDNMHSNFMPRFVPLNFVLSYGLSSDKTMWHADLYCIIIIINCIIFLHFLCLPASSISAVFGFSIDFHLPSNRSVLLILLFLHFSSNVFRLKRCFLFFNICLKLMIFLSSSEHLSLTTPAYCY